MKCWIMGVAVVLAAAGTALADDKSDTILKKAIEAHGGADALNKYPARSMELKGELTFGGMDLPFTGSIKYAAADKYKLAVDMEIMGQKLTVSQIVSGDKIKSIVNVAGMEMAAGGDDEKEELKLSAAMMDAERLTPLLDKKKYTVKAGDDEDVKGKKAAVLIVTPEIVKKEVKFYFDKTSGLLVKTSHKGIGPGDGGASVSVFEESFYSDFKKVNGVQVAMTMEVKHDDKKFMNVTLSNVELKEKIDDKEFAIDD